MATALYATSAAARPWCFGIPAEATKARKQQANVSLSQAMTRSLSCMGGKPDVRLSAPGQARPGQAGERYAQRSAEVHVQLAGAVQESDSQCTKSKRSKANPEF